MARKKSRKGGRKKVQGVAREPNGRISRRKADVKERSEMTEREAKEVVINARRRHTGLRDEYLDLQDAGRPNAGTVQGILRLRDADERKDGLSSAQYAAAEWFLGRRQSYLRAIQAPDTVAQMSGPPGECDEAAYAKWCQAQKDRWADIVTCIVEASVAARSPLMSAVDVLLVRQQLVEHMLGDLRIALNALDRTFLSTGRAAA